VPGNFKFKCEPCDHMIETHTVTTKYVEGHGVVNAVFCDKCNGLMELTNPREGFPDGDWGVK